METKWSILKMLNMEKNRETIIGENTEVKTLLNIHKSKGTYLHLECFKDMNA
jgi:hypothetical protein